MGGNVNHDIPFTIKIIKIANEIVSIIINIGTALVTYPTFQPLPFSFRVNSSQSGQLNATAFIFHITVRIQSHFQVSNQNKQDSKVIWFDWQS